MTPSDDRGGRRTTPWRWVPLLLLAGGLVAFFALGYDDYVQLDTLRAHRGTAVDWVEAHPAWAVPLFMLAYMLMVAFSLPGGALATIIGGFLFGVVTASLCVVISATIGASALFLAARSALGDVLRARAGSGLERMRDGFHEHALSYLLILRLLPIFPFWLVNLVPAFVGVKFRVYVLGTFLGIIPGSVVYAFVGDGLGELLDAGRTPDLATIFELRFLLPILALAVLASAPVVYKLWRRRAARV